MVIDYRNLFYVPNTSFLVKPPPLKRNETMVDLSDSVLVIWDGVSKGTQYTINYATKKNKAIRIITTD